MKQQVSIFSFLLGGNGVIVTHINQRPFGVRKSVWKGFPDGGENFSGDRSRLTVPASPAPQGRPRRPLASGPVTSGPSLVLGSRAWAGRQEAPTSVAVVLAEEAATHHPRDFTQHWFVFSFQCSASAFSVAFNSIKIIHQGDHLTYLGFSMAVVCLLVCLSIYACC